MSMTSARAFALGEGRSLSLILPRRQTCLIYAHVSSFRASTARARGHGLDAPVPSAAPARVWAFRGRACSHPLRVRDPTRASFGAPPSRWAQDGEAAGFTRVLASLADRSQGSPLYPPSAPSAEVLRRQRCGQSVGGPNVVPGTAPHLDRALGGGTPGLVVEPSHPTRSRLFARLHGCRLGRIRCCEAAPLTRGLAARCLRSCCPAGANRVTIHCKLLHRSTVCPEVFPRRPGHPSPQP
jgi:hypothetical protein